MPPLNFSVPDPAPSQSRIDAELKSITVTTARPDEQTGKVDSVVAESSGTELGSGTTINAVWKESLQEALDRSAIFKDGANKKVSLSVKILKLDTPTAGASMTTDVAARYEIIDRATGRVIYTQDVNSSGTTPFNFAFLGIVRGLPIRFVAN